MAIVPKALQELPPASRKLYERAHTAVVQKNYFYAFEMLRGLLRREPGFNEGRTALRQTQLERVGNKPSLMRQCSAFCKVGWRLMTQGPVLLKQEKYAEALDLAETAMEADPTSTSTLSFLAKTAEAAGLLEIAIQALEISAHHHPRNNATLINLARLYTAVEEYTKALKVWQTMAELHPNNPEIEGEVKRLMARAAMKQAKWTEAESYRDVMKDKGQAETLEQQTRVSARDEDTLQSLTAAAEKAVEQQSTVANHRRLAQLYRQGLNYDKALEQYQLVIDKMGSLDPAIDDAIMEVHSARFDDAIKQWQGYAQAHPDKQAEAAANIGQLEKQKDEMRLTRLLERVRRYPNDAGYRFDLGLLYWTRNEVDLALQEFQQSQRNPQYRRRALAYMGRCMVKKGLPDMALEQFRAALDGMDKTDPERKDCLYDLAAIYETKGMQAETLAAYREIFSLDVNYRDVGAKLQAYYKQDAPV